MNSSTIIKKTLPLLVSLLIIIAIGIACAAFSRTKDVPSVTSGYYLTAKEGNLTYEIRNEDVYVQLKNAYGEKALLELIDKQILKTTYKDQVSYWDLVTNEAIDEAIDEAIFPGGKDKLTAEEITDEKEKYMYNNGLRTDVILRDYHRLLLARRLYAEEQLTFLINETNQKAENDPALQPFFTEENYNNYYEANYRNGYWTIIVPFTTETQAYDLLKQLGYTIHRRDTSVTGDFDRWQKTVDDEKVDLTQEEIIEAFINMYNTVQAAKVPNFPAERVSLKQDVHYNITEGKYSFNTTVTDDEELDRLYYSYQDMVAFQRDIEIYIKRTMKEYIAKTTDEIDRNTNWYTPVARSYNNATLFVFIMKIAEEPAQKLEDVKDEIYDALFKQKLTEAYIQTELAKLRAGNNLVILDPMIEESYILTVKSYKVDHKETKESSKTNVAQIDNVEFTADDLFNYLDKRYGMNVVFSEINFLRLLINPEFNQIYDYANEGATERNRILDADKWQSIREAAMTEKSLFSSNAYWQYGFPSTYGWKNFLRDVYGIHDEKDTDRQLLYYFLYREITSQYASSLGDVNDVDENSDIWKSYQEKMEKVVNEFFRVSGIHLLISVLDDKNQPVDPEKWTDYQNLLAKELYQQVWTYMRENPGENAAKFQDIANAFRNAPRFLAHLPQNVGDQPQVEELSYVFKNIEVSRFKTAGLSVKFEDLGTFTNGSMVKPFNDAVKSIWDAADKPSNEHIPYANAPDINNDWNYLVTQFGYHAYINTNVFDIEKWDKENNKILPTLQMVKTHLLDPASPYLKDAEGVNTEEEFTTAMKQAVSTYFVPIRSEITGQTYPVIQLYLQIKELDITFILNNYTREEFNKFLDLKVSSNRESLKYFAVEEE